MQTDPFDSAHAGHYGVVRARSVHTTADISSSALQEKTTNREIVGVVGVGGLGGVGGALPKSTAQSSSTGQAQGAATMSTAAPVATGGQTLNPAASSIQDGYHETRHARSRDIRSYFTFRNCVQFIMFLLCTLLMTVEILLRKYVVTVSLRNYIVMINLVLTLGAVITFSGVLWFNSHQRRRERRERRRLQAMLSQGLDPLVEAYYSDPRNKPKSFVERWCCCCCCRKPQILSSGYYRPSEARPGTMSPGAAALSRQQTGSGDGSTQQTGDSQGPDRYPKELMFETNPIGSPESQAAALEATKEGALALTPRRTSVLPPVLDSTTNASTDNVARTLSFGATQSRRMGRDDEDDDDDDEEDADVEDDADVADYDEEEGDFEEGPETISRVLNPAASVSVRPRKGSTARKPSRLESTQQSAQSQQAQAESVDSDEKSANSQEVHSESSNQLLPQASTGPDSTIPTSNSGAFQGDSVSKASIEYDPYARLELSPQARRWELIFFYLLCNGCTCWTKRGGHRYVRGRVPTLRRRCRLLWLRLRYILGIAIIDTLVLLGLLHSTKRVSASLVGLLTQMVHPATAFTYMLFLRQRPSKGQILGGTLIVAGAGILLAHAWQRSVWAEEAQQQDPIPPDVQRKILQHFRAGTGFWHTLFGVLSACGVALSSFLRERLLTHPDPKIRLREDVALAVSASVQLLCTLVLSHPVYAIVPPDGSPASSHSTSSRNSSGFIRNISHGFQCWLHGRNFITRDQPNGLTSILSDMAQDLAPADTAVSSFASILSPGLQPLSGSGPSHVSQIPPLVPTLPVSIIIDNCKHASLYGSLYFGIVFLLNVSIVLSVYLAAPGPYFAGSFAAPYIAMVIAVGNAVGVLRTEIFPLEIASAVVIGVGAIIYRIADAGQSREPDPVEPKRIPNKCSRCLSFVFCGCECTCCCDCCASSRSDARTGLLDEQIFSMQPDPISSTLPPTSTRMQSTDPYDTKNYNRVDAAFNIGSFTANSATINLPSRPTGYLTSNLHRYGLAVDPLYQSDPYGHAVINFGMGADTPAFTPTNSMSNGTVDPVHGRSVQNFVLPGSEYRYPMSTLSLTPTGYQMPPGLDALSYHSGIGLSAQDPTLRAAADLLMGASQGSGTGAQPRQSSHQVNAIAQSTDASQQVPGNSQRGGAANAANPIAGTGNAPQGIQRRKDGRDSLQNIRE